MWKLCCESLDLAKVYRNPNSKYRIKMKDFLNKILRIPVRTILDTKSIKYEIYSPNLPIWLYRGIIKSLRIGNGFSHRYLIFE